MEMGPALMLLAGLMVAGFRWMSLELMMERRLREAREQAESMEAVLAYWRASGGQLALVGRDSEGNWRILDFPGEDWLPLASGDGGGSGTGFLWRRRRETAGDPGRWQVEHLDWRSGEWEWRGALMDGAEKEVPGAQ